ncbi:MAG: hypothetical protein F6K21_15205 [Symploca sp. SIO2D2]|nr:hypothetical protein [Symploca sp. SIO2D2]
MYDKQFNLKLTLMSKYYMKRCIGLISTMTILGMMFAFAPQSTFADTMPIEVIPINDRPFLMPIKDILYTDDGLVVKGFIEQGTIRTGDTLETVGFGVSRLVVVKSIYLGNKPIDEAMARDTVSVTLGGIKKSSEVERGQVLAQPGSIQAHTEFKSEIYMLTKEEGGRVTPIFNGYRPQFYFFRTVDITGVITLPEGTETVSPGETVEVSIKLISPIALQPGTSFEVREGGRGVATGEVSEIIK